MIFFLCTHYLDPTVRVAALSVFETLALSEPITPEIFNILAKPSNVDPDSNFSDTSFNNTRDVETEEIVNDDFDENDIEKIHYFPEENNYETHVSALVQICFKNVSNEVCFKVTLNKKFKYF